jgi:hypothetical protein
MKPLRDSKFGCNRVKMSDSIEGQGMFLLVPATLRCHKRADCRIKWYQAGRMAEEILTLCEDATVLTLSNPVMPFGIILLILSFICYNLGGGGAGKGLVRVSLSSPKKL